MLGSVARSKPEESLCGLHVCFWLCVAPAADFLLLCKGFKSLAQKTEKYVQKVRGIKEKDGSDGAGGGGGVLPVLAPSSRRSPLGGVRDLPTEPGLLCVTGGCPLPGV